MKRKPQPKATSRLRRLSATKWWRQENGVKPAGNFAPRSKGLEIVQGRHGCCISGHVTLQVIPDPYFPSQPLREQTRARKVANSPRIRA